MPSKDKSYPDGADLNDAIVAKQRRVASYLQKWNLSDDLSLSQQAQLAKTVLRYQAAFRQFRQYCGNDRPSLGDEATHRLTAQDLPLDRKHGPAQRRMFSRKVGKAIAAIEDALAYANDDSKTAVYARTLQAFAVPRLGQAREALIDTLEWNNLLQPPGGLDLPDPRTKATAALMEFFCKECHLPIPEARFRTAEIFTRFQWRESGAAGNSPDDDIRRETEAVRKRQAPRCPRPLSRTLSKKLARLFLPSSTPSPFFYTDGLLSKVLC
jgi:hypothetical protein